MTTASAFAESVARHVLAPWPAGQLIAAPIAGIVESLVTRVHGACTRATGRSAPFDAWLATLAGVADQRLTGDVLGQQASNQLMGIVSRTTSMGTVAGVTTLPPPPGGLPPLPVPSLPGFRPPTGWTEREVTRALLLLGRIGALEVATLPARMAVASAIAGIAVATPGIRSTAQTGSLVHGRLQGAYRGRYLPNLIVADRQVWGGVPPRSGTPLAQAATSGPPSLGALYMAWLSSRWMSTRRSDVTDLTRAANWEVKPFLEAPTGVLQEAWYRCSYNWVAQNFAATNPALAGMLPWLLPGPPWDLDLMKAIPVSTAAGPGMAVPFSTLSLPGMVVYAVVSGPTMADIVIIIALMVQLIEREIRKRLQEVAAAVGAALAALGAAIEAVAKWIVDNVIQLVIIIAAAGILAALIVTAPVWAPAIALKVAVVAAVGVLVFIVNELIPKKGPDQGTLAATPMTLDLPGVSVRIRPQDVPWYLSAFGLVTADAMGTLGSTLERAGPVPVA